MPSSRFTGFVALVAGLALLAVPGATATAAKVKVKDGAYYQVIGKQSGYVATFKGRITSASATLKFRKGGQVCIPDGLSDGGGVSGFGITPKHPVVPGRTGRFVVAGKNQPYYPKLNISFKGRFRSNKLATFTVKAWQGGCVAKAKFRKARHIIGG